MYFWNLIFSSASFAKNTKTTKLADNFLQLLCSKIAFKLVNEIDVETTKQAIDRFAAENRELIKINADRLVCLFVMRVLYSSVCIIS